MASARRLTAFAGSWCLNGLESEKDARARKASASFAIGVQRLCGSVKVFGAGAMVGDAAEVLAGREATVPLVTNAERFRTILHRDGSCRTVHATVTYEGPIEAPIKAGQSDRLSESHHPDGDPQRLKRRSLPAQNVAGLWAPLAGSNSPPAKTSRQTAVAAEESARLERRRLAGSGSLDVGDDGA